MASVRRRRSGSTSSSSSRSSRQSTSDVCLSDARPEGLDGVAEQSRAEPSLRPKPGGGYTMPPAGSGESDVLSYCTFFCAVYYCGVSWFASWWLALCLGCADADAGPTCCSARGGVRGGLRVVGVCVCVQQARSQNAIYKRDILFIVLPSPCAFLGVFRGSMEDAGARAGWGASGSDARTHASCRSSCVDRGGQALHFGLFTRAACMRRGGSMRFFEGVGVAQE